MLLPVVDADTVGLMVDFATEPPAARETSPTDTLTTPTVAVDFGVAEAVTFRSPPTLTVDVFTKARVVVAMVLLASAPPPLPATRPADRDAAAAVALIVAVSVAVTLN